VVIAQGIGKEPQRLVCPLCRYDGFSIVTYSPNSTTWISCFVLGFFGFCCIPFCVNSLQRATHQCPSCRGIIAVAD
jgi:lipopolysaccharide-induced tumor necrosis factor-alpha factor